MKISNKVYLLVLLLLVACSSQTPAITTSPTADLPRLSPPAVSVTHAPDARTAAQAYLDGWKRGDYASMYAMLAPDSQKAITAEAFTQRYQSVSTGAALKGVDYQITSAQIDPDAATISYRVTLQSNVAGDISRDTSMKLLRQGGEWRVIWDDTIILPELAGGAYFGLDLTIPERAPIYDRYGRVLATQMDATSVGLYPSNMDPENSEGLLSMLANVANMRVDTIEGMIERSAPGDYLALAEVPTEDESNLLQAISGYSGAMVVDYYSRFYPFAVGPHVVGYVSAIKQEELQEYLQRGYRQDARVGRKGIEAWGEDILAGKRGGTLFLFNKDGQPISQLGQVPAEPGQPITTTLDFDLQRGAQRAIIPFRGAIAVLERNTGRVLAMVSSPGFDSNAYETENYNWSTLLNQVYTDPAQPEFNRAAEGLYPLGSVFKIITMAAGLESGAYTPETPYECTYDFNEVAGLQLHDWTWEYFQEDGETQPSGRLTLVQGLMRSCNPFFWHIGVDLYRRGLTRSISDMARGFGLGSLTGIQGVNEEAGTVPDPAGEVDAVNLAIGQGNLQVTPLQVADFVAAVGNGGILYTPQVIDKIGSPGNISFEFKPEVRGKLPAKPETLAAIQRGMIGAVSSKSPRGTAYRIFSDFDIPVAGKTGTAESGSGDSHAWFAGYTMANRPDKPDIAIAVIVENIGQGSDWAAPIFRRIVELYFYGKPVKLYRWEAAFNVTRTPTPLWTETPTPTPEEGNIPAE